MRLHSKVLINTFYEKMLVPHFIRPIIFQLQEDEVMNVQEKSIDNNFYVMLKWENIFHSKFHL